MFLLSFPLFVSVDKVPGPTNPVFGPTNAAQETNRVTVTTSLSVQYPVFASVLGLLVLLNLYQLMIVDRIKPEKVGTLPSTLHKAGVVCGLLFCIAALLETLTEVNDWMIFSALVVMDGGCLFGLGYLMLVIYQTFTIAILTVNKTCNGTMQRLTFGILFVALFFMTVLMNSFIAVFNSTFYKSLLILSYSFVNVVIILILWVSFFEIERMLTDTSDDIPKRNSKQPMSPRTASVMGQSNAFMRFKSFAIWLTVFLGAGTVLVVLAGVKLLINPTPFFGQQNTSASFSFVLCCAVVVFSWTSFYSWKSAESMQLSPPPSCNTKSDTPRPGTRRLPSSDTTKSPHSSVDIPSFSTAFARPILSPPEIVI